MTNTDQGHIAKAKYHQCNNHGRLSHYCDCQKNQAKETTTKNITFVATMVGLTCHLSPSPHCLLPSPEQPCLLQGQPLQFVLGKPVCTIIDEFLNKFQTAFDPPPLSPFFGKMLRFFSTKIFGTEMTPPNWRF